MREKKVIQMIEYKGSSLLRKIDDIKQKRGMKFLTEVIRFCINEVHRIYSEEKK